MEAQAAKPEPSSRHRDLALVGVGVLIGVLGSRAISQLTDGGLVYACAPSSCPVENIFI